ncbi:MAG TPA: glutamate racemase [Candidatus Avirikenella pullistercoris]|nr:glutamate racemase [Candidatus Avirikenella pullistercoris]
MPDRNSAIGVFDSGMGGLTVLKEIIKELPEEDTIYYADAGNCPYGEKSRDEIIRLTDKAVQFLLSRDVKLIVIACNTATTSAIGFLRSEYDIPFVAMEPAVKPAVLNSKTGVIGVLATKCTIEGEALKKLCRRWGEQARIIPVEGHGLVEIVEHNREESSETYRLLSDYIGMMAKEKADHIVLGCTHYPFLEKQIKAIIGDRDIRIVNPAPAIAARVKDLLRESNLLNKGNKAGRHSYYSSSTEEYTSDLQNKIRNLREE